MHRIQEILIRDRLKFRFGLSKINVSGEKVSKLIDRTMYSIVEHSKLPKAPSNMVLKKQTRGGD